MNRRSFPLVLTAPSGTGKTTICRQLLERVDHLRYSVSATTRAPRAGEVAGQDYLFLTADEFEGWIREGRFLEYTRVFGHAYGTPKAQVYEWLTTGNDVLLALDVDGSSALRALFPDCVTVFVLPPSMDELRSRLNGRAPGVLSDEERARLARAPIEMSRIATFDYLVVNDELERAVEDVAAVVRAERLKAKRQGGI